MCYASIAFATDYDCWHVDAGDVSIGEVLRILAESTKVAKQVIRQAIKKLPEKRECICSAALKYALITDKSMIPEKNKKVLELIIGKYM